jgi:uncharacterized protein YkwD
MTFSFKHMRVILILALALVIQPLMSFVPEAALVVISNNRPAAIETEILDQVNRHRQSKGLNALVMQTAISEEAANHSRNMANRKTPFGHDGFDGRVKKISQKITGLKAWAENVAFGQLDAKGVVTNWLKSPGHRKNIEGKYTMTGIGVVKAGDGTLFFTQIFASK